MSEPRRMPGRFAWLLPLAVFVLVLSLMPSENPRPRKLPFNEMLSRIDERQIARDELRTRDAKDHSQRTVTAGRGSVENICQTLA